MAALRQWVPGRHLCNHPPAAQAFVYVLEGTMIMQVKGGPSDIHAVSENASKTQPAKFLAILIKDKGKPATVRVPQEKTH
ncbi:MAG TPA: hypothetical protein VMF03_15225 [Steroidobacteraceae bacterium]|nr:hypothetical protein [Steroidobacteraceae bacterium]